MIEIRPFKALLYNTDKVDGDVVTSPPYDVIDENQRETLYNKSPYNIIRIDFGKEFESDTPEDKYIRSRNYLHSWIGEGILKKDDEASLYIYEIKYSIDGKSLCLKGVLALMKLQELGHGIYPHEATHSKPKADRLNLLKSCHANISPIFTLYRGNKTFTDVKHPKIFESKQDDGTIHTLYKVSDINIIKSFADSMKDKPILIADGHHRYEVSLQFKKLVDNGSIDGLKGNNVGDNPWDYVLTYLVDINDSDITILPTHRLIKDKPSTSILDALQKHFDIRRYHFIDGDDLQDSLSKSGKGAFGLYLGKDESFIIKYKGNALNDLPRQLSKVDTVILQELILKQDLKTEDITYEMDLKKAIKMVDDKVFNALFVLNHTPVEEIEEVALANLRMPPKSTYFYPKLLTGMAIYTFF
ncbi:MAG: DUF1015 domain-containing protein [Thermodesulfovibrionales bacterium]|nr:DUF1015 domain-containing protein [Thermodesulfovibrionales bacterium]